MSSSVGSFFPLPHSHPFLCISTATALTQASPQLPTSPHLLYSTVLTPPSPFLPTEFMFLISDLHYVVLLLQNSPWTPWPGRKRPQLGFVLLSHPVLTLAASIVHFHAIQSSLEDPPFPGIPPPECPTFLIFAFGIRMTLGSKSP